MARVFREAIPELDTRRGAQARNGADASDVEGIPGLWIECKHQKRPNPEAALRQAELAARGGSKGGNPVGQGRIPIAVIRKDRGRPFVCLGLADFLDLCGDGLRKGITNGG